MTSRTYYHGTGAHAVPSIFSEGLRPTLGAGSDALLEYFGCPVLLNYWAKSLHVAAHYPIYSTTGPQPESRGGLSGADLVAYDGTPPLRATLRGLARSTRTVWSRKSNQSGFMPQDVFITHLILWSCDRRLLHAPQNEISILRILLGPGVMVS